MRFVIYGVFLVLWFVMWVWTYSCHIKQACCAVEGPAITEQAVDPGATSVWLGFAAGSDLPVVGDKFVFVRDSLLALLTPDQKLLITGHYSGDDNAGADTIALATGRARAALELMAEEMPEEMYQIAASRLPGKIPDANSLIEAVTMRIITSNASVREIEDIVLIYFPFNSTEMEEDPLIAAYFDRLVEYLSQNDDQVVFTGHTDGFGPPEPNYELGLWRANAMKESLVQRGISGERIIVKSMGELAPIADNRTKSGAKLNRRVELTLIKQ